MQMPVGSIHARADLAAIIRSITKVSIQERKKIRSKIPRRTSFRRPRTRHGVIRAKAGRKVQREAKGRSTHTQSKEKTGANLNGRPAAAG